MQVSNVDATIVELMASVRWPPNVVDFYGDLYLPCSAGEQHTNFTEDSAPFYALQERLRQERNDESLHA